ncbi:MAG: glycosyltransferase family 4 protein [Chloroflexi bacterium]|nr:glycosyltransferase family 4 protein [Chloroflexota bacterium]
MPGRFSRARLLHIWRTMQKGPTEVGYAYFRARRRRRNIADDEPLLSESDQLAMSGVFDADDELVRANAELIDAYRRAEQLEIRRVLWFLPYFHHVYFGGVHTLLRFADRFAREHGVHNHFHCYDVGARAVPAMARKATRAFPGLSGSTFTSPEDHPPDELPTADAAIATLWSSVYMMLRVRNVRARFYFVQDHEPEFYPAGAASALVEETYRLGIPGIVNTPGLADVYRSYGNPAVSFIPAVDLERYYAPAEPRSTDRPVRVFFYGRPQTPRNAFGLGLSALHKLKQRYGDRVEVICAGEHWNPAQFGLAGQIDNLGVLPSLDDVAELYRACDIGLVFMQTKHPSYQPLEFMASGMVTVSNVNPATAWLLRDGENCLLTRPLPTSIADTLGQLVEDAELRVRLAEAGRAQVSGYRWAKQIDHVWDAMCLRSEGFGISSAPALVGTS